MRNLKRALSLALASVMLLGMMVVGTSAASYTDVDENDNVEAIEVLNAVNVMIGRQGNFEPDEAVNRHEMAVIMAKLYLGVEAADNYVGSHPFTDVVPWADKYVAACYENGLVAGTSATTYGGGNPLTAVQAAAMMLRALGYKDLNKDYKGDWRAPITAMANQIRLFNGVATNPSEQLNRNQVAQLALNTLKSPVVTLKDNTISWSNNEGQLIMTGGSREYIVRFSQEDYAYAINDTETAGDSASGIQGATIELGEHLYNGKLQLNNVTDDFGRPSRKWEYNGKTIGTYVKEELMVKEYVGKVTGKDLYDQLGSTIVNDYDLTVTVDGVNQNSADAGNAGVFGRTSMDKNNKAAVGRTGTGTLTQVFVDNRNISARKDGQLYIAIINTYLAKASQDYDSKKEELAITIYGARRNATTGNYVKDSKVNQIGGTGAGSTISNVKLAVEDFPSVTSMKKDDYMLVNVAGGDVITVKAPEILSGVKISGFKINSDVVVDGNKYEFATTAHYKDSDLAAYTSANTGTINLQDTTYNIYLDQNGKLVGVEEVNPVKNYVFITGSDQQSSNYTNKTAKALALFLDGTTEEITYKRDKGTPPDIGLNNVWCTYTKDNSGVYTLRMVAQAIDPDNNRNTANNELAQFNTKDSSVATRYNGTNGFTIDSKNSTLDTEKTVIENGVSKNYDDGIIYGRDDTVYLVAELDHLTQTTVGSKREFGAVKGAETVIVDVKNADLKVWNQTKAKTQYKNNSTLNDHSWGVYALYNDGYGIIAAVVIGEDNGASRKWYNTGDNALIHEDYDEDNTETRATYQNGEWVWTRTLFDEAGNEVTLTERGDSASYLKNMDKNQSYLIKLDSKGEVYRAYCLPGDDVAIKNGMETVIDAGLTGYDANKSAADNSEAEYVTDVDDIGDAVRAGKNQMLVSCDVPNDKMTVSESGVLYANKKAADSGRDSGILVDKNTKIVLIQINRNNRDTYTDGVGFSDVKSIIEGLNEDHNNNNYHYKISAVLDKRVAKSIVIWDYTSDWTPGQEPIVSSANVSATIEGGEIHVVFTDKDANLTDLRNAVRNVLTKAGYTNVSTSGMSGAALINVGTETVRGYATAKNIDGDYDQFDVDYINYWTVKVNDVVVETVPHKKDTKLTWTELEKKYDITKGTGSIVEYAVNKVFYAAYNTYSSPVVEANDVFAPISIETGYVALTEWNDSDNTSGGTGGARNYEIIVEGFVKASNSWVAKVGSDINYTMKAIANTEANVVDVDVTFGLWETKYEVHTDPLAGDKFVAEASEWKDAAVGTVLKTGSFKVPNTKKVLDPAAEETAVPADVTVTLAKSGTKLADGGITVSNVMINGKAFDGTADVAATVKAGGTVTITMTIDGTARKTTQGTITFTNSAGGTTSISGMSGSAALSSGGALVINAAEGVDIEAAPITLTLKGVSTAGSITITVDDTNP